MTRQAHDRTLRRRDQALRRLRRAKQALATMSVVFAAVVATAAARTFPGHSGHAAKTVVGPSVTPRSSLRSGGSRGTAVTTTGSGPQRTQDHRRRDSRRTPTSPASATAATPSPGAAGSPVTTATLTPPATSAAPAPAAAAVVTSGGS